MAIKALRKAALAAAMAVMASGALADVPQLKLGADMRIPQLGIGVWELSSDEAYKSVLEALKIGYRLVDTAQYYRNEAAVYKAIVDSGVPRKDIFLMSKLNPDNSTEAEIRQALDESLDNLGGHIDLMLIHWPTGADTLQWKIMEEYQKAGKFGAIGVSNYRLSRLKPILDQATVKPVLDQIEIDPYYTRPHEVRELQDAGIVVQAWSPLGAGRQGLLKDRVINEIARKHGKTAAQVILRWDIQHGLVTIPRSRNPAHIRENYEITGFSLDDAEMKAIDALDRDQAIWRN